MTTKMQMMKAMTLFAANMALSNDDIVKKTGLTPDGAARAMKLAAAGVTPQEISTEGARKLIAKMKLPRLLSTILKERKKSKVPSKAVHPFSVEGLLKAADGTPEKGPEVGPPITPQHDKGIKIFFELMNSKRILSCRIVKDADGKLYRETLRMVREVEPLTDDHIESLMR